MNFQTEMNNDSNTMSSLLTFGTTSKLIFIADGVREYKPEELLKFCLEALSSTILMWQQDFFPNNLVTILGSGKYQDMVIRVGLGYYGNQSVLNALDSIETDENIPLPIAPMAAILFASCQLNAYKNGNIPHFFIGCPEQIVAQITAGLDGYFFKRFQNQNMTDWTKSRLLTEDELIKCIRDIDIGLIRGETQKLTLEINSGLSQKIIGQRKKSLSTAELFPLLFTKMNECRPLDAANWIVTIVRYFWSNEWWNSNLMREFSIAENSILIKFIKILCGLEIFCRKPVHSYKEYEFSFGYPQDKIFSPDFGNNDEFVVDFISVIGRAWIQLVELYSTNTPVEVVKALIPNRVYQFSILNVDLIFDVDNWMVQVANLTKTITEKTNQNAKFVPYGHFYLQIPNEFVSLISNIELKKTLMASDKKVDLDRIHIFCDDTATGFWARLYGKSGAGPVVRWISGKPLLDNMLSIQFAVLLGAIFSALWYDLRCQGEISFKNTIKPTNSDGSKGEGKKRHHRSNSATHKSNVKVLPHSASSVSLSGIREWSTDEERESIKRNAHSVSGHGRTLPLGWKRNPRAEDEAMEFGLILLPNQTFVHPHSKGLDAGGEIFPENPTKVVSRGLATLMTFFIKANEERKESA